MDLTQLRAMDAPALERLYIDTPLGPRPQGRFRGAVLAWMNNRGARDPFFRTVECFAFELLPWGIDFGTDCWFFVASPIQMGRFAPTAGPSRWRPTETYQLHYGVSHLPPFVKKALYDEVKPLSPDVCLGIGGINRGVGEGDHFFFALVRDAP